MPVLLTGTREWTNKELLIEVLDPYSRDTLFIHGGAKGLDSLANSVCLSLGFVKPHVVRPEYKYWIAKIGAAGGKIAPMKRNCLMLDGKTSEEGTVHPSLCPNLVLAFFLMKKETGGTAHCVAEARKRQIPILRYTPDGLWENITMVGLKLP